MRRAIPLRREGIVIPPGAAAWSRGLLRASAFLVLITAGAGGAEAAGLDPGAAGQEPSPPVTRPAGPTGETLTIDRAVALAFEGNLSIKSAALEVSKAEDELGSSRTYGFPSINLYALESRTLDDIKVRVPAGAFGDFPATGPIPASDTEVSTPAGSKALFLGQIAQPLTQLGRVSLGVRVKRANLDIAREKLRARRQAVRNDVRSAYYALLRDQTALEAAEEAVRALTELDRVVQNRTAQKVELPAGGLEVKARLSSAEYEALTLRNGLVSGRERLNDLLGRPIDVAFGVDPVPDVTPYESDLEAARAAALSNRADLRELRLRRRQAEFDHRMKKWDFVPDVSLTYSYLSLPDIELLPSNVSSLGLVLSWEPFDWGRRRHALAESRASVEQSDLALREAESQAEIEVGVRLRGLQEARSLQEATRLAQEAARERLRETADRYRQKAALLKDVLEDQQTLAAADQRREEALLAAWRARADLEKALGED